MKKDSYSEKIARLVKTYNSESKEDQNEEIEFCEECVEA